MGKKKAKEPETPAKDEVGFFWTKSTKFTNGIPRKRVDF